MTYALDSNIISYIIRKNNEVMNRFKEIVDNGFEYNIPPMVYYEVKRWLTAKNATAQLALFDNLCRSTNNIVMDNRSWNKAVEIYAMLVKSGNIIGDGDILIASYCIVNDYTLVTNNTKDFERIPDLEIENWV